MNPRKIRAIAADLLNTGRSRVYIEPTAVVNVKEILTKEDVKKLIKDKRIKKKKFPQQSKSRARKTDELKARGRRRGAGKRKGKYNARINKKESWMKNIRAQRRELKRLRAEKKISKKVYRKAYKMSKGAYFKGKKHLISYVEKELM